MQKGRILIALCILSCAVGCVYAQTWTRHLAWEDLVPAWEDHPDAEAYNVIPAIGGGYLMHGVLTLHDYEEIYVNMFWKLTPGGEVVWRNDQLTYDLTPMTCLVSNGSDKYYGLSPDYHRNILYTYDSQLNPIHSIMIDTLLTNGEFVELWTMVAMDDGLVLGGRNGSKAFIMKLDYNQNIAWSHTFYGLDSVGFDDIKLTLDGGLICAGGEDMVRMNTQGDTLWVYSVSPPVTGIFDIVCNIDGTYSTLGYLNGNNSIMKFDQNGSYLWGHQYIILGNHRPFNSVVGTPEGHIVKLEAWFSGSADPWDDYGMLHEISLTGEVLWNNVFYQHPRGYYVGHGRHPLFIDDQGYYILCIEPMILIRADEYGNAVSNIDSINDTQELASIQAYPNPASRTITFRLENVPKIQSLYLNIYNLKGQIIKTLNLDNNAKIRSWLLPSDLTNGIYLYKLLGDNIEICSGKMTIIK